MKRILIATTIPETIMGFLLPYVEYFKGHGCEVDGMAHNIELCPDLLQAFDKVWDVSWSRNPFDFNNIVKAPYEVRRIVSQRKYDLVHVHTPVAAFVTRLGLRSVLPLKGTKIIYTAHGFHFQKHAKGVKNATFYVLEKLAGKWTDFLVVINQEDYSTAIEKSIIASESLRYMPGIGIDTNSYNRSRIKGSDIDGIRNSLGLEQNDKLLLIIAAFDPGKRHFDALQAFSQLNRQDVHMAFAGTGPMENKVKEMAVMLKVNSRVHFLGFRKDVPALIASSVAVVLPSEREGLPRSIMEAQALETPCIGTNIRGIRDLLSDGCGLLVELGDFYGLRNAMEFLLDNPDKAKHITELATLRLRNHDIKNIIRLHEELYTQILPCECSLSCLDTTA